MMSGPQHEGPRPTREEEQRAKQVLKEIREKLAQNSQPSNGEEDEKHIVGGYCGTVSAEDLKDFFRR